MLIFLARSFINISSLPSRIVVCLASTSKQPRKASLLIAGCVIAAILFVILLVAGVFLWRRRIRRATMPLLSDRMSTSSIAHSLELGDPQYRVEPFPAPGIMVRIPEPEPIYHNGWALSSTSSLQNHRGSGITPTAMMRATPHISPLTNKRQAARSAEHAPTVSPLAESLISQVVALRRDMDDLRAGYGPPPQYHPE